MPTRNDVFSKPQMVRAGGLEGLAQAANGKALDGTTAIKEVFTQALFKSRE